MRDGKDWAASAPFDWYVHGDFVLDTLSGRRSAQDIRVVALRLTPTPEAVRGALRVEPLVSVLIEDLPHRRAFTIDDLVLTPDGALFDIQREAESVAEWPPALRATTWDLTLSDLVRLAITASAYPDLKSDATLNGLAANALAYAQDSKQAFPEISGLLESLQPYTRWREPAPQFAAPLPASPQS